MVKSGRQQNEQTPIRVAQIIGKMWAGGVEAMIFNYYKKIDKAKVQFDFFYEADSTMEPPQELIELGARFYCLPPYQRIWEYIPALRKYLRENQYQIVHSHLNTMSVFPLYAAYREGVPVRIAHNHSVPAGNEWKRNALKYFLRMGAKLFPTDYFACSEKTGRWLFGNETFNEGKVTVIKNAIDFSRFRDREQRQTLMERYGLDGKFVVGHVGRFTYAKNHMFLLEIFREILKLEPSAVLLLVGDGELHDQIVKKVTEYDLTDRIILAGQTAAPEIFYSVFDVVVVPSVFEGLSMTTIEAQVSETPVVISEAVPQEAVIAEMGCQYLRLSDAPEAWARRAVEVAKMPVKLAPESGQYDIESAAPVLTEWYMHRLESLQ